MVVRESVARRAANAATALCAARAARPPPLSELVRRASVSISANDAHLQRVAATGHALSQLASADIGAGASSGARRSGPSEREQLLAAQLGCYLADSDEAEIEELSSARPLRRVASARSSTSTVASTADAATNEADDAATGAAATTDAVSDEEGHDDEPAADGGARLARKRTASAAELAEHVKYSERAAQSARRVARRTVSTQKAWVALLQPWLNKLTDAGRAHTLFVDDGGDVHPAQLLARVAALRPPPPPLFDATSSRSMLGLPPCHLLRKSGDPRETDPLVSMCRYTDDTPESTPESAPRPPPLPNDVRRIFDPRLQRFFFYSELYDVSSWNHPSSVEFKRHVLAADLRRRRCSPQVECFFFFVASWPSFCLTSLYRMCSASIFLQIATV